MPRSHWSAVSTPLFDNISQLLRDSFSVSQELPICEFPSHSSLHSSLDDTRYLLMGPVIVKCDSHDARNKCVYMIAKVYIIRVPKCQRAEDVDSVNESVWSLGPCWVRCNNE